jgi:hypothetical protein
VVDVVQRLEVLATTHHLRKKLVVIFGEVVLGEVKGVGEGERVEELCGVGLVVEEFALLLSFGLGCLR